MLSRARTSKRSMVMTVGSLLSSLVSVQALAMAGTSPPTATSHPVDYCADRDGDGRYDPNDCTQWHVEPAVGPEALYDVPTNIVYRRKDLNIVDNCPQDVNTDQKDTDHDGIGDLCDYVEIGVGANHSCAIRNEGSVGCWGDNSLGQLNAPLFRFSAITVGRNHACGLLVNWSLASESNKVLCWGDNSAGQLNAPGGQFQRLKADGDVTCGVRADGTARCWGGCGSDESCTPFDPSTKWFSVSPAFDVTPEGSDTPQWTMCGVKGQSPYEVQCFGRPPAEFPQGLQMSLVDGDAHHACSLGMGTGQLHCFTRPEEDHSDPVLTPPPGFPVRTFSVGKDHACAIATDQQRISCWGSNAFGKSTPPAGITGPFATIGAGENHTCVRKENGQVICWGDHGVADGTSPFAPDAHSKLLPVSPLYNEISGNEYVLCGVTQQGELRCSDLAHPGYRAPAGKFYDVWVGEGKSCGYRRDGQTVCWNGQTGLVNQLGNVSKAVVRQYYRNQGGQLVPRSYTCGIFRSSGKIFCHDEGSPPPSENDFQFGPRFTDIGVMGERTVCGITSDQRFLCQEYGSSTQIEVKPGKQFSSMSCTTGDDSMCCAHDGNDAYCLNADGQTTRHEDRTTKLTVKLVPFSEVKVTTDRDGCYQHPLLNNGLRTCVWPGTPPDPNKHMGQLEMGPTHGCTLFTASNKAHCWTEFGETSGAQQTAPLSGLEFQDLASGIRFSCGLTTWGSPACWGGAKPDSITFRDARGRPLNGTLSPVNAAIGGALSTRANVLAP
jgi:hypothetical protein